MERLLRNHKEIDTHKKIPLKDGKNGQHVIGLPFLFVYLFTCLLEAILQATTKINNERLLTSTYPPQPHFSVTLVLQIPIYKYI